MGAMQFAEHPLYRAALFRRTFADLIKPGALMDRAHAWLRGTGSRWEQATKTWYFPSGATLSFGFVEDRYDEERWQGTELHYIGIDEITQWVENQYLYLFSRLRKLAGSDLPVRMRSTANPGGRGHAWVKARFIDAPNTVPDRATIRALIADNPSIDAADYEKSLLNLDPVTRRRFMGGDWDARESGGIFRLEWFRPGAPSPDWCPRIRYWDCAATEGGGDRTAGVRMSLSPRGVYVVEHSIAGHWGPGNRDGVIVTAAGGDTPGTVVGWEEEGGSSGKSQTYEFGKKLPGYRLFADHKTGRKVLRWGPFASQAQLGNVEVVPGPWNQDFFDELTGVKEDESAPDDIADAASGAYLWLTTKSVGQGPLGTPMEPPPEDDDRDAPREYQPFASGQPRGPLFR